MESVFQALQTCNARKLAENFYVLSVKSNVPCCCNLQQCHQLFDAVRTGPGRRKQHLSVNAARMGLHTWTTFRNKTVAKSNE